MLRADTTPERPASVTMATVAAAAGVSPMTVSYSYNRPERVSEATRARVLAAAARLGYAGPAAAASSLRTGRTGTLGVVLSEPLTYAFDDPQAARFLSGVAAVCAERGLGLTLIPTDDPRGTGPSNPDTPATEYSADRSARDEAAVDRVRRAAVDGYVVWTTVATDPVLDAVLSTGRPVAVHGGPARKGARLVTIDDRAAARAVTAAAFARARRPAVLSFPTDFERVARVVEGPDVEAIPFPVTRNRLLGARDHCRRHGIRWSSVPVGVVARNQRAAAREVIDSLLDAPRPPDAIAAMSDELALACLDVLRARGLRVREDVAVTGWDGTAEATAADLTTVEQSLYEQGRLAARLALGERGRAGTRAPWRLVERGSTRR